MREPGKTSVQCVCTSVHDLHGLCRKHSSPSYSPAANHDHPTTVYWGDTHAHTSFSSGDAFFLGNNIVTPEIAYRFARGDVVEARNGMKVKMGKPLELLVIADHAEGLGVAYKITEDNPGVTGGEFGDRVREQYISREFRGRA